VFQRAAVRCFAIIIIIIIINRCAEGLPGVERGDSKKRAKTPRKAVQERKLIIDGGRMSWSKVIEEGRWVARIVEIIIVVVRGNKIEVHHDIQKCGTR
jgi:hypothetical protein